MGGKGSKVHALYARAVGVVLVGTVMAAVAPVGVPLAYAPPITANTYWVDASAGLDTNPGTEAEPYKTITWAVGQSDSADTIIVRPGTYSEATDETFPLVINGQSLVSSAGKVSTIIDGGSNTENTLNISGWEAGDRLQGFTIRNGGKFGVESAVFLSLGPATSAPNQPKVADCTFYNCNGADGGGLKIGAPAGTTLVVQNNYFENCSAANGGALHATTYGWVELKSNTFVSNTGNRGGAVYLYTGPGGIVGVEQNVFLNNNALSTAGAIEWHGSGFAGTQLIEGNGFYGSSALSMGALYLQGIRVKISRNTAGENVAPTGTSGFAYFEQVQASADNNYIYESACSNNGAVWTVDPTSTFVELNDTITGTSTGQAVLHAAPGAAVTVTNCIYWNPAMPCELRGGGLVEYSCSSDDAGTLAGNSMTVGAGMVYAAPVFSAADGEPVLDTTSSCVEAGKPGVCPPMDIYTEARPQDFDGDRIAVPDIGCIELAGVPLPTLVPVYRFYNFTNNTHFYTDSASERDMVIATWPNVFRYEGEAYYRNPANNTTPLTRLYNKVSKSHFYTANPGEAAHALATWPSVFQLDGPTYAVNPGPVAWSVPVYRFYNLRNGSHFFTASEAEKNDVVAKYPTVYQLEGPAFWIGQ